MGLQIFKTTGKYLSLLESGWNKVILKMKKKISDSDWSNDFIQQVFRNGIWHWKIYHAHNEKWWKGFN